MNNEHWVCAMVDGAVHLGQLTKGPLDFNVNLVKVTVHLKSTYQIDYQRYVQNGQMMQLVATNHLPGAKKGIDLVCVPSAVWVPDPKWVEERINAIRAMETGLDLSNMRTS
jgi:hypothetical protein